MSLESFWHGFLKRPYRLRKVIDKGNGPVNVVLVHGLASRSQIWTPLIKLLEDDNYRVISYDLLGFGVSPKPGYSKYSTHEHAKAIIHSLRKETRRSERFVFVGHSMGCLIATHIAYKWPARTDGVILYKPPLLDFEIERSLHRKFYKYLTTKPSTLALYVRFANKFSGKLSGFRTDDEYWLPIANSLNNTILAQRTLRQLEKIRRPIHIIYGRFDFLVSKIKAKKLVSLNPRISLHYFSEMHDVKTRSSRHIKKLIEELYG